MSPPPGAEFCMSDHRVSDLAADALLWRSKRRGVNSSFGEAEAKVVKYSPQAIITLWADFSDCPSINELIF